MSQHTASKYPVCCEITGADITAPTAMWTRPDTGDARLNDSSGTSIRIGDGDDISCEMV